MSYAEIDTHLIDEPLNAHRLSIDNNEIEDLADSIKKNGLINPVTVRPSGERYEIVAGHRRYLAMKRLNWEQIPAMINENASDNQTEIIRASENLERSDLSPIEEARIIWQLVEEANVPIDEIARKLSRSIDWINQRILLASLPEDLIGLVHTRQLPIGHALQLMKISDFKHRHYLTGHCTNSGASFRIVKSWTDDWLIHSEHDTDDPPPEPQFNPTTGAPIILMPCHCCAEQVQHTQMQLLRLCTTCATATQGTKHAIDAGFELLLGPDQAQPKQGKKQ